MDGKKSESIALFGNASLSVNRAEQVRSQQRDYVNVPHKSA